MEFVPLLILVIFVLIFLSKIKTAEMVEAPYELAGPIFTPAERSFYGVLNLACESRAVIFGKVRIADILKPIKGLNRSDRQKAFNKISAKHFDFVLCDPNDLSVIAVIELDDQSHSQKKQMKRDEFVGLVCETAHLKLHRFKASATYIVEEIKNEIFNFKQEVELTPVVKTDVQSCPKCTAELVVKTAQKGKNKGNDFLACSRFPKCRYTEEIEV